VHQGPYTHDDLIEGYHFGLDCIRKGPQLTVLPIFSETTAIEPFIVDCLQIAAATSPMPDDANLIITTSLPPKTKSKLTQILIESLQFD
jgi:hypothetical protein